MSPDRFGMANALAIAGQTRFNSSDIGVQEIRLAHLLDSDSSIKKSRRIFNKLDQSIMLESHMGGVFILPLSALAPTHDVSLFHTQGSFYWIPFPANLTLPCSQHLNQTNEDTSSPSLRFRNRQLNCGDFLLLRIAKRPFQREFDSSAG